MKNVNICKGFECQIMYFLKWQNFRNVFFSAVCESSSCHLLSPSSLHTLSHIIFSSPLCDRLMPHIATGKTVTQKMIFFSKVMQPLSSKTYLNLV